MRKFFIWNIFSAYEDARNEIDLASGYPDQYTDSVWQPVANVVKDVNGRVLHSLAYHEYEGHEQTKPVIDRLLTDDAVAAGVSTLSEIDESTYWELRNAATPPGEG